MGGFVGDVDGVYVGLDCCFVSWVWVCLLLDVCYSRGFLLELCYVRFACGFVSAAFDIYLLGLVFGFLSLLLLWVYNLLFWWCSYLGSLFGSFAVCLDVGWVFLVLDASSLFVD